MADVLTGKANPSGKLTMTWPISVYDVPSTKNFPQEMDMYTYQNLESYGAAIPGVDITKHEEDIWVGYRYFDTNNKKVAYPFGYGLSYTTFDYSKPSVQVKGNTVTVTVTVKNTGSVAGKEVAQVYVKAPKASYEKPAKELKSFAKTRELKPGESETLKMTIPVRDLASFDQEGSQWVTDGGTYTFLFGANVEDIRCQASAKVAEYKEAVNKAF